MISPFFGLCPNDSEHKIQRADVEQDHWFYCEVCKLKWYFGTDILADWRDGDDELWQANYEKLQGYSEISFRGLAYQQLEMGMMLG